MTPDAQQSQREYIITESDVAKLEYHSPYGWGADIAIRCRSRPHTQAPSPDGYWTEQEAINEIQDAFDRGVAVGEENKADAARTATLAERERWMNILIRGKSALKELDEDGMRSFHNQGKMDVIEWIEQESLRTAQEQP